ncbi:MAG: hypothetical protein HYZ28_16110 [Myxococcales bacterium]|nr:hypothetical protein [Myxococcales bacterium]
MLGCIIAAIAALLASALLAALAGRSDRASLAIGTAGSVGACLLGLGASAAALVDGANADLRAGWSLPIGEVHVGIDPLSSFFLVCIFLVSGLAAVYGAGYLRGYSNRKALAPAVSLFNLLVASMAGIAIARDGVLFLLSWELMSIASFLLVTYEDEREEARRAGMTYLIASHLGVVFLFVLFGLLARGAGSFDFARFAQAGAPAGMAGTCFLLSLVGFGTKAGFWPVHIWLPDAHPAAPSHVSALMSGVMIKLGIYGIFRTLTFLGPPPPWWGTTLLTVGAISAVAGVLHALAQHDLKRLLAYHSVENIGIIALGMGMGLLGQAQGAPSVAFLGFAGALLHVLNHGLFKGLLFQSAGSVLHSTGTRDVESLGGLQRRMPLTALCFLVGSAAICGLPPLNGFASEWLVYLGAFRGAGSFPTSLAAAAIGVVPVLALVGGLAAACFVKAFGVVFLGEARTKAATSAHEPGPAMVGAMLGGATLCAAIGLAPKTALRLVSPAVSGSLGVPAAPEAVGPLSDITWAGVALAGIIALIALARWALLRGRFVGAAVTWGCGYASPTPRMQYTASSFASPLLELFASVIHARVQKEGPTGCFPKAARYEEHLGDMAGERMLVPLSRRIVAAAGRLRVIQQGRVHLYLVYMLATLIALLLWQLGGS